VPYATVVQPNHASYDPDRTSIRRGQRGGVVAVGGMVAALAAVVLGGCVQPPREETADHTAGAQAVALPFVSLGASTPNSTASPSQEPGATARGAPSPTSPQSPLISSENVVRAWFAALDAFVEAGHDHDWNSPGLVATAVQPELDSEKSELHWYAAAGMVAIGTPQIEGMQVDEVTASSAILMTCIGGFGFVKSSSANTAPTNGLSANNEELNVGLVDGSKGWKVSSEKEVGSKCRPQ
jgi:hypothetical protein